VSEALNLLAQAFRTAGIEDADVDARLLVGHALHLDRARLIAQSDRILEAREINVINALAARRLKREPVSRILGQKEFWSIALAITPDVLVPRPETELLVDWAGELLADVPGDAAVADLGTGSGAIALAIKHAHPGSRVVATDASADALAVAARNARRHAVDVELLEASWWRGLDGRRFAVVVANPPYVAEADAALQALRHEPRSALTPGGDGLAALREIVAGAPAHLEDGGWLLLEHGFDQAAAVAGLLADAGFRAIETRRDLAGHPRATGGRIAAGAR